MSVSGKTKVCRALRGAIPPTPPGPEGSNGNGLVRAQQVPRYRSPAAGNSTRRSPSATIKLFGSPGLSGGKTFCLLEIALSLDQPGSGPKRLGRAKITALGTYVPPRVLTNADLEKMVDTSDQWIVERTGIRERHIADKGVATSDLAVQAMRKCLADRGIGPDEVEVIIVATVSPDMPFPSTACLVQEKVGAHHA